MTMLHFAQIYSGGFRGFDGGAGYNLRVYGTPYPRHYGLKNARYPVAIFWGSNDWLATPKDVMWLAERLPNVVLNKWVTHFSTLWQMEQASVVVQLIFAHVTL